MKKEWIIRYINFWPPFIGAGIRVKHMSKDLRSIEVEMSLRFWNKNYMGTHFGGSLFSMTDPFYVLMLSKNLGRNYEIWDKAASIRFKKPAKGKIKANFSLTIENIHHIKMEADKNGKCEPHFKVELIDQNGTIVAEIEKTLSVKHKKTSRALG